MKRTVGSTKTVQGMPRRNLLIAGSLWLLPALPSFAGVANSWRMWIEQNNQTFETTPRVRLKRSAFTLVFSGPKDWAYILVTSANEADFSGKNPLNVLEMSARPIARYAEYEEPSKNTNLVVNDVGMIASGNNGMHEWADEADANEHDFTRFSVDQSGIAKAERDVKSILMDNGSGSHESVPIERSKIATISIIAAAAKPIGKINFVEPKLFTIVFD